MKLFIKQINVAEKNPISFLNELGAKAISNLNYTTTHSGIDFYVGIKGNTAIVVAFIDSDNYLITKEDAKEMAESANFKGIDKLELYTDYGVELHSKYETSKQIGFHKIVKVSTKLADGSMMNGNNEMHRNYEV